MRQKTPYTRPIVTMMTTNDGADAEEARRSDSGDTESDTHTTSSFQILELSVSVSLDSFEMDLSSRVGNSRVYNSIWFLFSVSSAVFSGKHTNVSHDCADAAAYTQPFKAVVCRSEEIQETRNRFSCFFSNFYFFGYFHAMASIDFQLFIIINSQVKTRRSTVMGSERVYVRACDETSYW